MHFMQHALIQPPLVHEWYWVSDPVVKKHPIDLSFIATDDVFWYFSERFIELMLQVILVVDVLIKKIVSKEWLLLLKEVCRLPGKHRVNKYKTMYTHTFI